MTTNSTQPSVKTHTFANGDRLPLLGLGTWKAAPGETYATVREAIKVGYRHIDCASLYGNEKEVGDAIRDAIKDGEVTRRDLFVTSKLWGNCHGEKNVEPQLRRTLADLGLEYVDLYLVHWPIPLKPTVYVPEKGGDFMEPSEVPLASTWAGFEAVQAAGLARHIGVSNFSSTKLRALIATCKVKPEVNQIELHPLLQQAELVHYCASENIHITAYSPLGSNDRPDFVKEADAPVLLEDATVGAIAKAHGATPAQVLLAWHVQRGTSTIPKSVKPARLRENLAAAALELTMTELGQIAQLECGRRLVVCNFWVVPGSPWTFQSIFDAP